jgi:hypothetical protein
MPSKTVVRVTVPWVRIHPLRQRPLILNAWAVLAFRTHTGNHTKSETIGDNLTFSVTPLFTGYDIEVEI